MTVYPDISPSTKCFSYFSLSLQWAITPALTGAPTYRALLTLTLLLGF
jgi:hypothetical protein